MKKAFLFLLSGLLCWILLLLLVEPASGSPGNPHDSPASIPYRQVNSIIAPSAPDACSDSISFSQTILCSIDSLGAMESITFSGTAGDKVRIRMLDTSGTAFVPAFWVYAPDGSFICYTWGDPLSDSSCTLHATGVYTLLAGDDSGTHLGSFSLFIQRLNNPGNSTPIAFSQTLSGSVTVNPELKAFTFSANAGDVVLIRMQYTSGTTFSPIYWVYAPDGSYVCYKWVRPLPDGTCPLKAGGVYDLELNATGVYTLLAGDYSGTHLGSFNLFVQRLNNPGNPTPITFGETLSDSITVKPELKAFTFSGTAGDVVRIRMLDTSGTAFLSEAWVYSPDGSYVCFNFGDPLAEINCGLYSTGIYTIMAGDGYGSHLGSFSLFVQRLNNPSAPVLLHAGETISSKVSTPPQLATFTFSATASSRILIRMVDTGGTAFVPTVWFYRLDGTPKSYSWGNPLTELVVDTDINGTYTLLAGDNSGVYSGTFNIYIQDLINPGSGVTLLYNQPITKEIKIPGEWNTFRFEGHTNERVFVTMTRQSGGIAPSIRVYQPNGAILCQGTSSSNRLVVPCTLTSCTTYTMLAGDSLANVGDYTFEIRRYVNNIPFVVR